MGIHCESSRSTALKTGRSAALKRQVPEREIKGLDLLMLFTEGLGGSEAQSAAGKKNNRKNGRTGD